MQSGMFVEMLFCPGEVWRMLMIFKIDYHNVLSIYINSFVIISTEESLLHTHFYDVTEPKVAEGIIPPGG